MNPHRWDIDGRRNSVDDRLLLRVAPHLTERDRQIVRLLAEHRVLTTRQVCDAAFDSLRRAEVRLLRLYRLRVVDRFRPNRWPESSHYHWVLDTAGAAVIARERGLDSNSLDWRHERGLALAHSSQLDHRLGANGFFTALLRDARRRPECALVAWWSAWRCANEWGELARPDGYGVWAEGNSRVAFILEYDRGTESSDRLAKKLPGYRMLLSQAVAPTWLVFCFPGTRREANARRALSGGPELLATAVVEPGSSPADAVWLPLGGSRRLRLVELAGGVTHARATA